MMITIINANRDALLSISGTRLWSGQNAQSFNTNGISWGGLGPQMFGIHGVYHMVPICLAIGVFLPLPFIAAWYIWPKAGFENFSTPIILQYSAYLSVGINTSVNPAMAIGIFSQWWVRTRHPRWFTKYKYVAFQSLDWRKVLTTGLQLHRRRSAGWWHSGHLVHPQLRGVRRVRHIASLPGLVGQRLQSLCRSLCTP